MRNVLRMTLCAGLAVGLHAWGGAGETNDVDELPGIGEPTGAASAAIEPLLLRALSGAYNTPEGASKAQTALAVLEALISGGK